jgi:methionyl-tRNA synthetase
MNQNKYYITTPIYYVNDAPHIGHAYTSVASDVIARFMRLSGKDVMYLTGTDEHGQKVEKAAILKNLSPQDLTDQMSESFRNLMIKMNISNDYFIRTTEERHKVAVRRFWQKLIDEGSIYLGKYSGWYSVRDEAFYDESELVNGFAPTGAPVEWLEEPSYFFALSKFQDKLLEFYRNNPGFILPETRRNEVVSFVESGLKDLSVSRTTFSWGIRVPNDEDHIIYVWLDALVNYISALGYPGHDEKLEKFWPADVHIVGKDILRFHAVYWPAFLMAAGMDLPKCIMAHGWWTNEGQKISKSLGNVIDPLELIEEFGVDQVRYYMMREIHFGNDGNYSRDSMINRINSELSNKIGNLLQRSLSFVYKNNDSTVSNLLKEQIDQVYQQEILKRALAMAQDNQRLIEKFDLSGVLGNIVGLAEEANGYVDREAPWVLKNTNMDRMLFVMYTLLEVLRYIGITLQPFTPDAAAEILFQLNIDYKERNFSNLSREFAIKPGAKIHEPSAVFPRF